ncbi:MAG TPA: N-acetyl-gamma-glutamyl-phosphate reductase [Gammaproteobacteria bacterium]|nr:N-acetyl-gamma-glutamyl-phosphate reductase [Gammaproteobacteria bacterium]
MIRIGIVGGSGYAGIELMRLLSAHPDAELAAVTSRSEAGRPVTEVLPALRGLVDQSFREPDPVMLGECDVVFFATPNGTAMGMARELLERGTRLIDIGADFRLRDVAAWERWYGMRHACPELAEEAVYGLPEINRAAIRAARVVANPGCYPTAILLGWLPLIEAGVIDTGYLVADAVSGTSGAGRGAKVATLFSEVNESFKAYAGTAHRHHPEIRQVLDARAGGPVGLVFVPHLAPVTRGMHASLYGRLADPGADLQTLFEQRYRDEPFVDVLPAGSHPETRTVRGNNYCRVAVHRAMEPESVVVLSVIDNLTKGAAGQAIQNMNLMFGREETAGLDSPGLVP